MKKVLILSTKTGHGHLSLAHGINEIVNNLYPKNIQSLFFDPLPDASQQIYSLLNSRFQNLWGSVWYSTNNDIGVKLLHLSGSTLFGRKLTKFISDTKPDAIISPVELVIPNKSRLLTKIKRSSMPKIIFYVADPFTPHKGWFANKDADLYLCASTEAAKIGLKEGIHPNKIKVVGWLSRGAFFKKKHSKNTVRKILGLEPDKFTLFMGGSGGGGGNISELLGRLTDYKKIADKSQIIVNTGYNYRLIKQALSKGSKSKLPVHVMPYIKNMPQVINACDLVVGKAGPNFLFECIHLKKPFFATGCLPGQEDGNLDFIISNKIGWVQKETDKAARLLQKIILNPAILTEKTKIISKVSRYHSGTAMRIAREVGRIL